MEAGLDPAGPWLIGPPCPPGAGRGGGVALLLMIEGGEGLSLIFVGDGLKLLLTLFVYGLGGGGR